MAENKNYVGNALVFPIKGRDAVGMTVTLNLRDLAKYVEEDKTLAIIDDFQLVILPRKPENVTDKITHSVKYKM